MPQLVPLADRSTTSLDATNTGNTLIGSIYINDPEYRIGSVNQNQIDQPLGDFIRSVQQQVYQEALQWSDTESSTTDGRSRGARRRAAANMQRQVLTLASAGTVAKCLSTNNALYDAASTGLVRQASRTHITEEAREALRRMADTVNTVSCRTNSDPAAVAGTLCIYGHCPAATRETVEGYKSFGPTDFDTDVYMSDVAFADGRWPSVPVRVKSDATGMIVEWPILTICSAAHTVSAT